jgi:hypothetical protein
MSPLKAVPRRPRAISSPASCGRRAVTGIDTNETRPTSTNAGQKSENTMLGWPLYVVRNLQHDARK